MGIDPEGLLSYFENGYEIDMTYGYYLNPNHQMISYDDIPKDIRKNYEYVKDNYMNYKYNGQLQKGNGGFLGLFAKTGYQWQKKNKNGDFEYVKESKVDKRIRQFLIDNFWSDNTDCSLVITPTESTLQIMFPVNKTGTISPDIKNAKCYNP
jgi:hypothetical protein